MGGENEGQVALTLIDCFYIANRLYILSAMHSIKAKSVHYFARL